MARSSQLGRRAARPADGEQAQKADGRSLRRQPVLMRVICGDDRERQRAGQVPSISAFGTLQVLRQSRQRRYKYRSTRLATWTFVPLHASQGGSGWR